MNVTPRCLVLCLLGLAACNGEGDDGEADTEPVAESTTSGADGSTGAEVGGDSEPGPGYTTTASSSGDGSSSGPDTGPGSETEADTSADSGSDSSSTGGGAGCTSQTCGHLEGEFTGTYSIRAVEQVGSTIVNDMQCAGTFSLFVDFSESPPLQAIASCEYQGGLLLFDDEQTAVLEAQVSPDGVVEGSLTHTYSDDIVRVYDVTGMLEPPSIAIDIEGALLPNPMSAVPWEVTGSLSGA